AQTVRAPARTARGVCTPRGRRGKPSVERLLRQGKGDVRLMVPNAKSTIRSARWLVALALVLAACGPKVVAPPEAPMSVRRGDQAFRYEEYEAAIESYRTYLDTVERGDYTARVFYKAALAQYRLGRYRDTLLTLDELSQRYPKGHWVQVDAL